MELLLNARTILLKSHHDKYLLAEKDEESVCQDKNGKSSKTAIWNVELVQGGGEFIRLKSCYGKYLTASDSPFLLGMTGKKVVQILPPTSLESDDSSSSSSIEWEPIRNGYNQIKLKSRRCGNYLRANGRLPPWRNSVTHDVPHRNRTQDWILWDVDVLEVQQVQPEEPIVEVAVEVVVVVAEEVLKVEEEVVGVVVEEADLEGGSPSSRFGFRKFLHKLNGGDGETGNDGGGEEVLEEGSSSSRFGFRKFLHELNGSGDGESSGGLLGGMVGSFS